MHDLENDKSPSGPRTWLRGHARHPLALSAAGLLLVIAALGAAAAVSGQRAASSPRTRATSCLERNTCKSTAAKTIPPPLSIVSTTPSAGAANVASDATVTVDFSSAVRPGATPSISPAVAGTWRTSGTTMVFSPAAPLVPFVQYTLTIPGGAGGIVAADGSALAATDTATFTVAPGSITRLQQLLAQLGYLPVAFTDAGPAPAPQDMALPQPGSFSWRWGGLPAPLTAQWVPGTFGEITKGAVMSFETQNGLTVDGNPGAQVWSALLADAAAGRADTQPVSYVLVTMTLPEHLTVWVNGTLTLADVPCNTGVPGATTAKGTFTVFEHVRVSNMRGSDITGAKYDVTVPWASYFNGGVALHGYPRAAYGFPQSNGCVEMPIATAGKVWPYTPLGTLVTVE